MLCPTCQRVSNLLTSEPHDLGQSAVFIDRETLHESKCELWAVLSKLLPAEDPHERRFTVSGERILGREIHVFAVQKLSDDGSSYDVEMKFTRHTHTPSPLTLANITICNSPG